MCSPGLQRRKKLTTEDEDLALQTLLTVRADVTPQVSEALLRSCYAIQRRHQFSEDRAQSFAAMERLIDEAVAEIASTAE